MTGEEGDGDDLLFEMILLLDVVKLVEEMKTMFGLGEG
jgi:hypothetical protein